jgi:hypothetical protein
MVTAENTPLAAFLLRRITDAERRRPTPPARPSADPVTGPSTSVPGNPPVPAPRDR